MVDKYIVLGRGAEIEYGRSESSEEQKSTLANLIKQRSGRSCVPPRVARPEWIRRWFRVSEGVPSSSWRDGQE